ncbi:MAG TPA: DUF4388 domain-containing protein, partial [Planctomycetota bacterium]|nr:DUF4388 domain-containing protein [Planctomycetota bacterium]
MALRGELLSADLAAVFQMVALNQQRGRLRVREKGSLTNRRQLYIEENRIRLDDRPAAHPIAAMLVEMGHINLVKYRGLKSRLSRFQGDQRVALRDQGVVDLPALTRVQARVEEELIMEMFLWKNITFELIEGVKPEREDAPVFILDHLIMEAARRSDEWGQHIAPHGFQHQICISTGQVEGLVNVSPLGQIVHEHLDGLQSGATLVEQIGLSRYHVEMALRELRQMGLARPLSAEELISAGDTCFRANSMEDARRLYRTALSERRLDLALHEKLAIVERSTGSLAKSCAHLRFCAHLAYEQGDMEAAYRRNQEVLDGLGTDLRPLFFNLRILAESPSTRTRERVQRCIQEGSRLASTLAEFGRAAEALELLDAVFAIEPNREDALVRRSRLLVSAGRTEEAVDLLQLRVAEREEACDLAGAASLLRLLQELHPSARHQYQARLAGLTRKRHGLQRAEKRSRIPGRIRLGIVALIVGLLTYNMVAFHRLQALPNERRTDEDHLLASREAHLRLARAFPLTWAARRAEDQAAALAVSMAELRAKHQAATEEGALERAVWMEEGSRAEAQGLLLVDSDPEAALKHFEAAMLWFDRLPESHPAAVAARKRVRETREYVETGRRLIEQYQEAMNRKDYNSAFDLGMRAFRDLRGLLKPGQLQLPCRISVYPTDGVVDVMGQA